LLVVALAVWLAWPGTTPSAPAAAPRTPVPPDVASTLETQARETRAWLARAEPGTHVIQLASAKEAARAAVLLERLQAGAPQPVRVFYGLRQGAPAWMIVAGEFANREAAMATLRTLPVSPDGAPFLRTVRKMRTVVLPTG
jgi:septal ring-binding cell division protein DamX